MATIARSAEDIETIFGINMSAGHPKVEPIMAKIRDSVKENTPTKNHYNVVYEAIWDLIEKIEELEKANPAK